MPEPARLNARGHYVTMMNWFQGAVSAMACDEMGVKYEAMPPAPAMNFDFRDGVAETTRYDATRVYNELPEATSSEEEEEEEETELQGEGGATGGVLTQPNRDLFSYTTPEASPAPEKPKSATPGSRSPPAQAMRDMSLLNSQRDNWDAAPKQRTGSVANPDTPPIMSDSEEEGSGGGEKTAAAAKATGDTQRPDWASVSAASKAKAPGGPGAAKGGERPATNEVVPSSVKEEMQDVPMVSPVRNAPLQVFGPAREPVYISLLSPGDEMDVEEDRAPPPSRLPPPHGSHVLVANTPPAAAGDTPMEIDGAVPAVTTSTGPPSKKKKKSSARHHLQAQGGEGGSALAAAGHESSNKRVRSPEVDEGTVQRKRARARKPKSTITVQESATQLTPQMKATYEALSLAGVIDRKATFETFLRIERANARLRVFAGPETALGVEPTEAQKKTALEVPNGVMLTELMANKDRVSHCMEQGLQASGRSRFSKTQRQLILFFSFWPSSSERARSSRASAKAARATRASASGPRTTTSPSASPVSTAAAPATGSG